jgi:hypothetical protein
MSTALPVPNSSPRSSRRIPVLAGVSGLVAAASITVTLAVAGGGGDSAQRPSAAPETAAPDRATLYQRGVESPQSAPSIDAQRSAERFHHFR